MKKIQSLLALSVVGAAIMAISGAAAAQQSGAAGPGNGLKIAPVRNDLIIEKGGTETVSLFVENVTASTVRLEATKNDFVASDDETGEPKIILDDKESAPGNSFKSLVGNIESVTLEPNERKEVKVAVRVPKDAASGGYYGAVRFAPASAEKGENVALTASAGSIFLVRVPGDITEKMSVESFSVVKDGKKGSLFSSGPVMIETRFRNLGNIHVQPFGKIVVKDMSGKTVQETEINNTTPRGSVLPDSIRKFNTDVEKVGSFGKYTAEANFGYGTNGELISAKKTFYIIPYPLIIALALIILFLIFGLPRIIKAYNRSVINKARRG